MTTEPSTGLALPSPGTATLPATYERAKEALDVCQRVDECKDWADKAAALASYAKQADDQTLHKLATRIQVRAVRRAGELLREFNKGVGPPVRNGMGAHTITQREAAEAAGFSKNQEVQAVRVANVPEAEFEAAVESDTPPTVTTLAARGTVKQGTDRPAGQWVPEATRVSSLLGSLARFCQEQSPADVVQGVFAHERAGLREQIGVIGRWVEAFIDAMEEQDHAEQIHRGTGTE
jgi:hypothetical protein